MSSPEGGIGPSLDSFRGAAQSSVFSAMDAIDAGGESEGIVATPCPGFLSMSTEDRDCRLAG